MKNIPLAWVKSKTLFDQFRFVVNHLLRVRANKVFFYALRSQHSSWHSTRYRGKPYFLTQHVLFGSYFIPILATNWNTMLWYQGTPIALCLLQTENSRTKLTVNVLVVRFSSDLWILLELEYAISGTTLSSPRLNKDIRIHMNWQPQLELLFFLEITSSPGQTCSKWGFEKNRNQLFPC